MVPEAADYIVLGGGTAGLVIANRLSENPNVSVVVIETGLDLTYDEAIQDPTKWMSLLGPEYAWQFATVPQLDVDSRVFEQQQGRALGGGSTINNAAFIPPSRASIDSWAKQGNPRWAYEDLFPYLKKSCTFHAPDAEACAALEIEEANADNRGCSAGPIKLSFPAVSQRNDLLKAWNKTINDMGYTTTANLFSENSVGGCCYSAAVDTNTGKRSSATLEYGTPASKRSNVTFLTDTIARKIIFASNAPDLVASGVEVSSNGSETVTVTAKKEVILCAGAYNSPKLLELSGIGNSTCLASLDIPSLIENNNVGTNLQNHIMGGFTVKMKEGVKAGEGFQGLAFMPLHDFVGPKNQTARKHFFDQFQPPSKHDKAHHELLCDIFDRQDQASCSMFSTFVGLPDILYLGLMSTIPFSRGSTHATSKDPAQKPHIDPQFLSHPADLEIMAHHLVTLVSMCSSPALGQYVHPPEGEANVRDVDAAKAFLRKTMSVAYHPCGTAAMLPREKGGVVDQELVVYGTRNLRVADASIFPLLTHANPMATVYAVAERVADLIKSKHG